MSRSTKAWAVGGIAVVVAAHTLWRHRQAADLHTELRRARYAALHDPLTGLSNRDGLLAHLHDLLSGDRPVWVLLGDLDRFKEINDNHGHGTGDRVLGEVAHRMRTVLRPEWTFARLHGDEFAGCGPGDLDTAITAAQAIRRAVGQQPMRLGTLDLNPVQMSIGVTVHRVGLSDAVLLRQADLAMYEAKDTTDGVAAYRINGADMVQVPVRPKLRDRDRRRR